VVTWEVSEQQGLPFKELKPFIRLGQATYYLRFIIVLGVRQLTDSVGSTEV
jgi:hypothetical protein